MAGELCDVCEENESVAVACSALGAISCAYCQRCANAGYEPAQIIIGLLIGHTDFSAFSPGVVQIMKKSLAFHEIGDRELWKQVKRATKAYDESMRQEANKHGVDN